MCSKVRAVATSEKPRKLWPTPGHPDTCSFLPGATNLKENSKSIILKPRMMKTFPLGSMRCKPVPGLGKGVENSLLTHTQSHTPVLTQTQSHTPVHTLAHPGLPQLHTQPGHGHYLAREPGLRKGSREPGASWNSGRLGIISTHGKALQRQSLVSETISGVFM